MDQQPTSLCDGLKKRGSAQALLHEEAAATAFRSFGKEVFVRAVVEISNHCRENCSYCGMRRDNKALSRYRAKADDLAQLLIHERPGSVRDVNIQAGEDPIAIKEVALPLIRTLRRETDLGVSVCLGTLKPPLYDELAAAGATVYIMKFEMADENAYRLMHAPGHLAERLDHIRWLAAHGWNVSSGFISGLPGQTEADLAANIELAITLPLAGCSVSPFIPGESTPLTNAPTADIEDTLNCMALMRLQRPDWVIPAVSALNLAQPIEGYRRGLRTGANLATINLTPSELREDYLLYRRERFIMTEDRILTAIDAEGLKPSQRSLASFYEKSAPLMRVNGNGEAKT